MSSQEHSPISAPQASPSRGAASLEEGGEVCGAIKAVTQKGCGFPSVSFESLRDLGSVSRWLPPLGLGRPQNRLAQGVGRSGSTDLPVLGESAKPSSVGPAKMLPPTRGEQSPAAPARKRRCPRPGSGCRGGDTPNAPSPASRHLYGSEKCFTGNFGKAVKCVCVPQHHCGASDGHRPAGCGRSQGAWRLRGLRRCWAPEMGPWVLLPVPSMSPGTPSRDPNAAVKPGRRMSRAGAGVTPGQGGGRSSLLGWSTPKSL